MGPHCYVSPADFPDANAQAHATAEVIAQELAHLRRERDVLEARLAWIARYCADETDGDDPFDQKLGTIHGVAEGEPNRLHVEGLK